MSKKRQRCVLVNLENNVPISAKFTVILTKISGKICLNFENKALINNYELINNRFFREVGNQQNDRA
jgi:hypothetical protein